MLLGVAGMVPGDWTAVSGNVVARIRELGLGVFQLRVRDPANVNRRDIDRVRGTIRDAGFAVGQIVGDYGAGLVSPDEKERAATVKFVKRTCNLCGRLGAANVYFRPGSLNPNGAWRPHPGNRSDEVFDRLVDSARQICSVAQNEGVKLAVEAGVVSPLYSAKRTREFFDAVDSRALGFNMDPVNYVGGLGDAYDSRAMMDEWFARLGHLTVGAHAKDFRLVDGALPHIEEALLGQGMLDQEHFLQAMQKACPNAHVLIEHLPDDEVPAAADALRAAADRAGIKWSKP